MIRLLHGYRGETNKLVPMCLIEELTNPCLPAGSGTDQTWTSCEHEGKDVAHLLSMEPADWCTVCYVNLPRKRILCEEPGLKT